MKNFIKNHGLWVLFAAAVIAVALAVMTVVSSTSSPLANLAGTVTAPLRSAYTSVAAWFNDKQNYYADITSLKEENQKLRKEIARMEAALRQGERDSQENLQLKELLSLREERQDLTELEAATITEHAVTNWTSSLTLNRGSDHGVAVRDCVISETGALVGVVNKVGHNWCSVLTTVDTDTSLGAEVFRTRDLGIAKGDFSLMEDGRLRLDLLTADTQLLGGDLVVTSGLGGYYPAGLVIGSVDSVQKDDSGAAVCAVLTPPVDFDQLTEVFIIKEFQLIS